MKKPGVWTAFVTCDYTEPVWDVIALPLSTEHEILIEEERNNTTSTDVISCLSLKEGLSVNASILQSTKNLLTSEIPKCSCLMSYLTS